MIENSQKRTKFTKFFLSYKNDKYQKNYFITYVPEISQEIHKRLTKFNIETLLFRTNCSNLGSLLVNNEDRWIVFEKSGGFKLNLADCDAIYIGQIGRNIATMLEKHRRSILQKKGIFMYSERCIQYFILYFILKNFVIGWKYENSMN